MGGGGSVSIYNPVRKKKHCALRPAFMWQCACCHVRCCSCKADGARRAHRPGLHTVDPPRSQPWERTRPRPSGMTFGLGVNCLAPGCSEGTPGHSKTTQRRECDALGRQTCARAGTRGVDRFSKTAITRRCAVWGCFWGPWASYLAGAQNRLPQRSRERAATSGLKTGCESNVT